MYVTCRSYIIWWQLCEVNFTVLRAMKIQSGSRGKLYSVFNLGVRWLTPRPGPLYPQKEDPVPNVQEAVWEPTDCLDWCGIAHKILELEKRKYVRWQVTCVFTNYLNVLFGCTHNGTQRRCNSLGLYPTYLRFFGTAILQIMQTIIALNGIKY